MSHPVLGALRTSSYTITIDLEDGLRTLLVHGYTGSFDIVSRPVATFVRAHAASGQQQHLFGTFPSDGYSAASSAPATAAPSDATVDLLVRRGHLTTKTVDAEKALVAKLAEHLHRRPAKPSYIVMPSYDCNLRCNYCFQDHLRTDARYAPILETMSLALVDRLFQAMTELEARLGVPDSIARDRQITLFGGEPLLSTTRPTVEYVINRARELGNPRIAAITNGTELHHYRDILGIDGIRDLQITLDGPPQQHDARRIFADRSGSFELIANNLSMALERGVHVQVRINVDAENVGYLPALAEEFVKRGWSGHPRFQAGAAAVHAANEHVDPGGVFDSGELHRRLVEMTAKHDALRHIHPPHAHLRVQLTKVMRGQISTHDIFRPSYCGAHKSMYVFDPFGDIYACWERTGDPAIRIGFIGERGELHLGVDEKVETPPETRRVKRALPVVGSGSRLPSDPRIWHSRTIASNDTCLGCRYAFFCGGGCAAEAVNVNGEFFSNHCDGFHQSFRATAREAVAAIDNQIEIRASAGLGC
jgi:uncharacterized protein